MKKQIKPETPAILQHVSDKLNDLSDWNDASIDEAIKASVAEQDIGFGKLGLPLRVALTGNTSSPALDKTLALIGKEQVLTRLARAISQWSDAGA